MRYRHSVADLPAVFFDAVHLSFRRKGAGGAAPRGLVIRQATRMAAVGLGLGLLAAFALNREVASMLYSVSAGDPVTLMQSFPRL